MRSIHPKADVSVALFLGGFDPSAGAGVLRDSVVVSGLGIHPMSVILAQTIQNGVSCEKISASEINPVSQLQAIVPHLRKNWGIKLSMFQAPSQVRDVMEIIRHLKPSAMIWDPIFSPTNGTFLHSSDSVVKLFSLFDTQSWVISPNIPEARLIAKMPDEPLESVAKKILDLGMSTVWIRGGHSKNDTVQDLWCNNSTLTWLTPYSRLDGDPRGTGCTVTSAWLAYRLLGKEPIEAAEAAILFLRKAWNNLHVPGKFGRPTFPPKVNFYD
ncbi:MAG: bifunctional hydroxymethylpyrimidine kinase/phosphomethylpyrimidine kinase [Holophagaceae bacterium]|nr:bifunctional hydroxymethylpyrimidine kinase/phosphomethylpyrimidine kinase [Holophagaceae bacterium]